MLRVRLLVSAACRGVASAARGFASATVGDHRELLRSGGCQVPLHHHWRVAQPSIRVSASAAVAATAAVASVAIASASVSVAATAIAFATVRLAASWVWPRVEHGDRLLLLAQQPGGRQPLLPVWHGRDGCC